MQLRNLRTLHLRFPHELKIACCNPITFGRYEVQHYLHNLGETMRYVASEIFLKLDKFTKDTRLHHRLDTIVIGHLTPLRQTCMLSSLPQNCFIKSGAKGVGDELPRGCVSHTEPGERRYRVEPVSRSMLSQLRAHTEVLDWDVGVTPFEQWAWRAL